MEKKTRKRTRRTSYKWKKFRKITKVGGYSYAVTLPMDVMRKFGWKEKQRVELIVDEKKKEIKVRDYVP